MSKKKSEALNLVVSKINHIKKLAKSVNPPIKIRCALARESKKKLRRRPLTDYQTFVKKYFSKNPPTEPEETWRHVMSAAAVSWQQKKAETAAAAGLLLLGKEGYASDISNASDISAFSVETW